MKKKILVLALMLFACMTFAQKSFAASDVETYTVTIPSATSVVLKAGENFGAISAAEVAASSNNTGTHVITVGAGDASDSYVDTTDTATAAAAQYTITFGTNNGSTIDSLTDGGTYATLVVSDTDPAASVSIILTDAAQSALPKLGSPAGSAVPFAVSGTTLDIAAGSSVPFSSNKAALSMKMDLDEGSVTTADAAGDVSFTMTLTAVGL